MLARVCLLEELISLLTARNWDTLGGCSTLALNLLASMSLGDYWKRRDSGFRDPIIIALDGLGPLFWAKLLWMMSVAFWEFLLLKALSISSSSFTLELTSLSCSCFVGELFPFWRSNITVSWLSLIEAFEKFCLGCSSFTIYASWSSFWMNCS